MKGATDVKVEEAVGLPFLEIKINKAEIARRGLSLSAVQDVIGAAIGGRVAGLVFEGDRRFQIVVRLPDDLRSDVEALKDLPVPLPGGGLGVRRFRSRCVKLQVLNSRRGQTRSAARMASGGSS